MKLEVCLLSIAAVVIAVLLGQCALPQGRVGTIDHNPVQAQADVEVDADISAALARVERLEVSLAKIDKLEAELNIGGEGDSIVSWILAAGLVAVAIATPLGGLFYQAILRPRRVRREMSKRLKSGAG